MRQQSENKVGEVYVRVRLSNAGDVERVRRGLTEADSVRACEVDALVDTGATRSVIPSEVAEVLGLAILAHATGQLANNTEATVAICSPIAFEILGRETFEDAYVMGNEVLIGQTTLETTDLLVDCKKQQVIPRHAEGPILRL